MAIILHLYKIKLALSLSLFFILVQSFVSYLIPNLHISILCVSLTNEETYFKTSLRDCKEYFLFCDMHWSERKIVHIIYDSWILHASIVVILAKNLTSKMFTEKILWHVYTVWVKSEHNNITKTKYNSKNNLLSVNEKIRTRFIFPLRDENMSYDLHFSLQKWKNHFKHQNLKMHFYPQKRISLDTFQSAYSVS